MKRALLFVLLAFSLTGCAARYYGPDRYWRDHDRYEHRHERDDRWR
jgi:hypothetical protein